MVTPVLQQQDTAHRVKQVCCVCKGSLRYGEAGGGQGRVPQGLLQVCSLSDYTKVGRQPRLVSTS